MKIVVLGGTGLIGARLIKRLMELGHEAVPASPSSGVDAVTARGLAHVLRGARVVVDVSNSPSLDEETALAYFRAAGMNLLDAAEAAGVRHHIALSILGTDRLPESGYFRAKMAQENLVRASSVPYTILRSAPFFEHLDGIVELGSEGGELRVSPAYIDPVAADDVVAAVCDAVLGQPLYRELEVVGPERFRLSELAGQILTANEDTRVVIADSEARYFGAVLKDDSLTPRGNTRYGVIRFGDWLRLYISQALEPSF